MKSMVLHGQGMELAVCPPGKTHAHMSYLCYEDSKFFPEHYMCRGTVGRYIDLPVNKPHNIRMTVFKGKPKDMTNTYKIRFNQNTMLIEVFGHEGFAIGYVNDWQEATFKWIFDLRKGQMYPVNGETRHLRITVEQ